jgi:hypothetical protein
MLPDEVFAIKEANESAKAEMGTLQKTVIGTFAMIETREDYGLLRDGLINLYKSIIEMAEYRIKVLEEQNGDN